ncbi:hypothetical protein SAMN03159339_5118 [Variovorax sp. 770b2]|nr:hypothetical protein SAMN03159339_5118 [Variovorax sp. 770b2]
MMKNDTHRMDDEAHGRPGNAAVLGIEYFFSRHRCMLGDLGYGSTGFERPQELAAALRHGSRFDLLMLTFDGDWRHVVGEMRALAAFFPRDVATLLVLHPHQISAAPSILMTGRSDFVMSSIGDVELTARLEILCRRSPRIAMAASGCRMPPVQKARNEPRQAAHDLGPMLSLEIR